jgi:hypothetical protein
MQLLRLLCDAQSALSSMQVQLTGVQMLVLSLGMDLPSVAAVTLTCSALPCQPALSVCHSAGSGSSAGVGACSGGGRVNRSTGCRGSMEVNTSCSRSRDYERKQPSTTSTAATCQLHAQQWGFWSASTRSCVLIHFMPALLAPAC